MLFQKKFLPYCDKASPYCFLQLCEARHAKPIFPLWQTIRPRKINSILIKRNQTGQRNALTSKQQGDLQLRGNQKDFNFQLHHHLSKFEVPVVVNLKHIFELFGLYTTCFLIQKPLQLIRRLSSDGQFWRKSQNKKGGKFELRSQLFYYNCTFLSSHLFQEMCMKRIKIETRLKKFSFPQAHRTKLTEIGKWMML